MPDKKKRGISNAPIAIPDIPDAPSVTAVNVGTSRAFNNGAATVTISSPTGGLPTSYSITTTPTTTTTAGVAGANTITGLSSATSYAVNVTATNSSATSAATTTSSFTATTVPQAPTVGTASNPSAQAYTGTASASVTFTPGATGGSAITSYTVTSSSGNTGTGASSPISVTGETPGTSRTYTVTATNANGTSTASSASNAVTPSTVPQAPTIGTATDGGTGTTVSVAFTAGATGGSAITGYTVTSSPGSITATGASSPITVSGLTTGTTYTFTVTATNANGTSAASAASNSVTPVLYYVWDANFTSANVTSDFIALPNGNNLIVGMHTTISSLPSVMPVLYNISGSPSLTNRTRYYLDSPNSFVGPASIGWDSTNSKYAIIRTGLTNADNTRGVVWFNATTSGSGFTTDPVSPFTQHKSSTNVWTSIASGGRNFIFNNSNTSVYATVNYNDAFTSVRETLLLRFSSPTTLASSRKYSMSGLNTFFQNSFGAIGVGNNSGRLWSINMGNNGAQNGIGIVTTSDMTNMTNAVGYWIVSTASGGGIQIDSAQTNVVGPHPTANSAATTWYQNNEVQAGYYTAGLANVGASSPNWVRLVRYSNTTQTFPAGACMDSSGNSYFLVWGPNANSTSNTATTILKYDSSGNLTWQRQVTVIAVTGTVWNDTRLQDIKTDGSRLFITGYYTNSVNSGFTGALTMTYPVDGSKTGNYVLNSGYNQEVRITAGSLTSYTSSLWSSGGSLVDQGGTQTTATTGTVSYSQVSSPTLAYAQSQVQL